MKTLAPIWTLVLLSLTVSCAPEPCGFGERAELGGCVAADHFHLNLDERLQMVDDSGRRGIGANACAFRAFALEPTVEEGGCNAYVFEGEFAQDSFEGSAGGVIVGLPEPILMAPDEDGEGCYSSDLFPSRGDLFVAGETIPISALGGNEFPSFDVELLAPETLAADMPSSLTRGQALELQWIEGEADVIVGLLATYDEVADLSTNIACMFNDAEGSAEIPAAAVELLQAGVDEADLYLFRQNWEHLEPGGSNVVVDVVATSSVTRRLDLIE